MQSLDIRLLDTTYSVEGDQVIVKLFGKTRENQSVTVLCPHFAPYCHVHDPSPELLEALQRHPDVVSTQEITLEFRGKPDRFVKVIVRAPWAVPKLRKEFEHDGDEKTGFFSADIIFTNRFIYDHDMETCIRATGTPLENRAEYTTDIVLKVHNDSDFDKCPIFTPKLKILSFDIESSIKYHNIYCICMAMYDQATDQWTDIKIESKYGVRHDKATAAEQAAWDDDEKRMIGEFIKNVRLLDPDVITGYNINNFDVAEIFKAAVRLYGKGAPNRDSLEAMCLGRDAVGIQRRTTGMGGTIWDVKGRLIYDTWAAVKKELKPKREQLGYVAQQLFGETKDAINSSKMDMEWTARRGEVVDYCLKDSRLAAKILMHPKINVLNKFMDVAIPSKLPVKETSGGQGRMIESVLIRMVDREGIAVPCSGHSNYGETREDGDSYEGGFVYDSKPGLWNWLMTLDFSSMYPSQIIKHNICFTTFDYTLGKAGGDKIAIDDRGTVAAFVPKTARVGIIPRMVDGFLSSRKQAKGMKKDAEKAGDKEKAEYYDRLQNAIKVLANATYGYFGTGHCRWYNKEFIAPSITAWAREEIKSVVASLEAQGCTVVAGDTDSVMFVHPSCVDLETCKTFGKSVQEQFSKGGLNLEHENVAERFFTHKKKRYFGKIVWPKEDVKIRGYEVRRTDSFDLQSTTMTEIFNLVLEGKPEEAVKHSKTVVEKLIKGQIPYTELVISKSVKDLDKYDNQNIVQVRVVKKMQALGFEFTPNMKYSWVMCKEGAEPVIEGVAFAGSPDYKYYAARLASALANITESFGCDEKMLLLGSAQRNLFSFAPEVRDVPKAMEKLAAPKDANAKKTGLTLFDFM